MSLVEILVLIAIVALALAVLIWSPKGPRGRPSKTQSEFFGGGSPGADDDGS